MFATVTNVRPTPEDLRDLLRNCKSQYTNQVKNQDVRDSQMVTLGQIGALEMVLGLEPDPTLPLIRIL